MSILLHSLSTTDSAHFFISYSTLLHPLSSNRWYTSSLHYLPLIVHTSSSAISRTSSPTVYSRSVYFFTHYLPLIAHFFIHYFVSWDMQRLYLTFKSTDWLHVRSFDMDWFFKNVPIEWKLKFHDVLVFTKSLESRRSCKSCRVFNSKEIILRV